MKRTQWKLVYGLAICLLFAATTASAKHPHQRPWKARGITTLTIDLTNYLASGDPICDFWAVGSGEATHFGRYLSGGVHTLNLETGEITGECWITRATQGAADQEQLFFTPTPISDDAFVYEITGGTGRFRDVAGSFIETTVTLSEEMVVIMEDSGEWHTYLIITSSYTDTGTITY